MIVERCPKVWQVARVPGLPNRLRTLLWWLARVPGLPHRLWDISSCILRSLELGGGALFVKKGSVVRRVLWDSRQCNLDCPLIGGNIGNIC
jgi:hypothetical protein